MSTPRISVTEETLNMEEPPSYDEARNRNANLSSPGNPSDLPSLHTPSIIEMPHRPSQSAQNQSHSDVIYDVPDIMPTLSMLGPPTELFPESAPYYLMLVCQGPTARLSGSHQPSLRLTAEYFKKWARMSPPVMGQSQAVPLLEVKIFGSRFSQRDYVDVAVITTQKNPAERIVPKGLDINPAMIVGFIQGVLGYRIIHIGTDVWHFQRDKVFLVLN